LLENAIRIRASLLHSLRKTRFVWGHRFTAFGEHTIGIRASPHSLPEPDSYQGIASAMPQTPLKPRPALAAAWPLVPEWENPTLLHPDFATRALSSICGKKVLKPAPSPSLLEIQHMVFPS
jgi:hypothetical protein